MSDWRPISEAPQQTRVWVGNENLPGWFADAILNGLNEWLYADDRAGPGARLKYAPTHFMEIPGPPPRKVVRLVMAKSVSEGERIGLARSPRNTNEQT